MSECYFGWVEYIYNKKIVMKLVIKVKPSSSQEKIEAVDENNYIVWTKEPPVENKANLKLIILLSKYFKMPKSDIKIIKGQKSKNKVVEI